MIKKFLLPACLVGIAFVSNAQNTPPPPPPPPEPPKVIVTEFNAPVIVPDVEVQQFYSRNETVSGIAWKNVHEITITRKDKTVEKYNMNLEADKKRFTEKYGEAPALPPPPPPAAPKKLANKPAKVTAPRQVQ